MKITDLKCAVIGNNPVVRIVTDDGIDGFGEIESFKQYLKPHVIFYKDYILGQDPTNVERVMMQIRRRGGASHGAVRLVLSKWRCGILPARRLICLSISCWAEKFVIRLEFIMVRYASLQKVLNPSTMPRIWLR